MLSEFLEFTAAPLLFFFFHHDIFYTLCFHDSYRFHVLSEFVSSFRKVIETAAYCWKEDTTFNLVSVVLCVPISSILDEDVRGATHKISLYCRSIDVTMTGAISTWFVTGTREHGMPTPFCPLPPRSRENPVPFHTGRRGAARSVTERDGTWFSRDRSMRTGQDGTAALSHRDLGGRDPVPSGFGERNSFPLQTQMSPSHVVSWCRVRLFFF